MSDWERVKAAYRLESYIPGLKKAGRLYIMCCPFHAENTPSFKVDPEKQQWRCWGACATGGDIFTYAMRANGWTQGEALRELAAKANIKIETRTRKEDEVDARLLGLLKVATEFYHDVLLNSEAAIPAMGYLIEDRGLSVSDLETWQIGYAPAGHFVQTYLKSLGYTDDDMIAAGLRGKADDGRIYDRFYNRIMFPIHDERGRVRGFSARVMPGSNDDRKYINSPQSSLFDKSSLIYGLYQVKTAQISTQALTIVEGQMDAICAHKHGFKNVCAQMGTSLTDKHLKALSQRVQRLILCMDNDNAGQSAMHKRARDILSQGSRGDMDIRIASLGTFKDPDELIKANPRLWTIAMNNARPIVDVMIESAASEVPADGTIQQKTIVAKKTLDVLRSPDNPMETTENTRKLAVALNLPESVFVEWAAPQLRVLPKTQVTSQDGPPLETAILHGIIVNGPESWLQRANAALICACPINQPLPHALGPLRVLDFTHAQYQHLFTAFLEHGDDLEDAVVGTGLESTYHRVVYQPLLIAAFAADTPANQQRDTLEEFLSKVLRLRWMRLKEDIKMISGDHDRFMELMRGTAYLQEKMRTRL